MKRLWRPPARSGWPVALPTTLVGHTGMMYKSIHFSPGDLPVAYLVRKGTKIVVRKPSGVLAGHSCRDDCLFQNQQMVSEHKTIQFQRDGFVISVRAADVSEVC